MNNLTVGAAAPDFVLRDANGIECSLRDYRGKWLVLYFYPMDNTPGCTKEACHFQTELTQIQSLNAEVIGVSTDREDKHASFSARNGLGFTLLSDKSGNVTNAYGALFKLGWIKLAKRHSFIINPEGYISRIYRMVNPASHAIEILAALKELQESSN